ncbi:hypothetical protein Tco_0378948 [Tanacetum coccineum]
MFINFRYYFNDNDGLMICKYFLAYTRTEVRQFRDTLVQHMKSIMKFIDERAQHKREYDSRMNEIQMQSKEEKVTSSSLGNYITHAVDADIRLVNDQVPFAEVEAVYFSNLKGFGFAWFNTHAYSQEDLISSLAWLLECAGLKGKKPKTVDDDECETSKQGSKKGDGRRAVNETLSKAVKERWDKIRNMRKKGGLVEHYSKLWRYGQAILDTNPGSTCELETEVNDEDGKLYFRRDDFNLGDKGGINITSYGHRGVAATSMESVFLIKVEEIKMLDEKAHERLVERNPNSWCRAYFEKDRCSAAFENGI